MASMHINETKFNKANKAICLKFKKCFTGY